MLGESGFRHECVWHSPPSALSRAGLHMPCSLVDYEENGVTDAFPSRIQGRCSENTYLLTGSCGRDELKQISKCLDFQKKFCFASSTREQVCGPEP